MREKILTNQLSVKDNTNDEGYPLDSRCRVNSLEALESMAGAYEGLHVYNLADGKEYIITEIDDGSIVMSGVIPLENFVNSNPNAVLYTEQTLTNNQKQQARQNIGAGTSDFNGNYNDLTDKPTISDGQTSVNLQSEITINAQTTQSSNAGVTINQGQSGINISFQIPKGADGQDGDDAYAVYESTVPEGQTPMSKAEWLASLKGEKGDDGHNPCLGRLNTLPADLDAAFPNAIAGDYIYVDITDTTATPPTTTTYIYHFDGTDWDAQGTEVNISNETFKSGESLHSIPIDNSHLETPSTASLAKAVDVVGKIQPIDFAINGNPGTQTEQEIDYSGPDNEHFKAANRKLIPANGRITYNANYTYDTIYYYQVNNGDALNIHIPQLGTTNSSATILGFSTREYPHMSDLSPVAPIVKFDQTVSNYGSSYADNNGQGYDIENYTVEVPNVGAGTLVWLVICAYGVVTDYTTYDTDYIPTVNKVITTGQETGLLERVTALEEGTDATGSGILELNPEKEVVEKLKAHKFTDNGTFKGITFAHISDYHYSSSTENYERFIEFVNHYKEELGLVNDAVDTGDLTDTVASSAFDTAHDDLKALDGFDNILLINGNHDTDVSDGTRWYGKIGQPVYNREFKAHAEPESGTTDPWGVTFPSSVATDYACYYYKDYSCSGLASVRAIFLDVMDWNTTQQTWLNSILADAISTEKHVIIFAHYLTDRRVAVKCSYCRETGETGEGTGLFSGEMSVNQGAPSDKLTAITNGDLHSISYNVQQFIDAGGVFVGYICGHRHLNKVGYLKKYPKQWFVNITSGKRGEPHDYANDGKRGQDNFELVTVNTFTNCLNLIKIGGRYNNTGSLTNTLGINYDKGSIVSEGYSEPIRATFGDNKNRPYMTQGCDLGYNYYDTTLEKLIHWDGKKWAHADGTAVVDASDTTRPTTNIGTGYQFKWTHEVNSESQEDLIIYQNGSWRYVNTSEFVKDSSGSSYNSVSNPYVGYQFWDTNDLTLYVYNGTSWLVARF